MRWSLFVDTDSLYLATRRCFDIHARMDYLNLPLNIVKYLKDIKFFRDKLALVMRHGKEWTSFVSSLEHFGYIVVPTDRGMQLITMSSQLSSMMNVCDGIVMVSANENISKLINEMYHRKILVTLVTFKEYDYLINNALYDEKVNTLFMDSSWLWDHNELEMNSTTIHQEVKGKVLGTKN